MLKKNKSFIVFLVFAVAAAVWAFLLKGGEELMGKFVNVKITGSNTWALYGEAE